MTSRRVVLSLTALFWLAVLPSRADLLLATNGATEYRIVTPAPASGIDAYAASELALYLKQLTGADFPVIQEGDLGVGEPAVFVGLSAPALARLGGAPLAALADQEHVARSLDADIFLYGKGGHGALHAALEFLETSLDWRWYSVFEHPVLPQASTVALAPFARTNGFSFGHRNVTVSRSLDYYYQQGMNMGYDSRVARHGADPTVYFSEINDVLQEPHTLFRFIPPDPATGPPWPWLDRTNYFATHPEYFSLSSAGQRVKTMQLCFSNAGLRQELTRNVLMGIAQTTTGRCSVSVSANDTPGSFCYCGPCRALEAQYQGTAGPLIDYLIELCGVLATNQPEARVSTLAYRRSQTQKPPVLPVGQELPANLVIDFAPIEDNYFADWTHPDPAIQETYADLCEWGQITAPGNLWAWMYPNPWGSGLPMPVGNVERLINNMRRMHQAGVRGAFTDHNGYHQRAGWSELQAYLFYKLCQDIDADTNALVVGFTDDMYGPAGGLIRQYLGELEAERKAMTNLPPDVRFSSVEFDTLTFPYLTAENIHRWQGYFEQMEAALVGRPVRERVNARLVRRELDLATLWKWFELGAAYPGSYTDHSAYTNRIAAINATRAQPAPPWENKSINREWYTHPLGTSDMQFFSTVILGGGVEAPLPAFFDATDPELIRTFVPTRYSGTPRAVLDPDAAWGYAVPVDSPNFPFSLGFYQWDTGTWGRSLSLDLDDIVPGGYQLVTLGEIHVTPSCWLYFAGGNWQTHLNVGRSLYEPGGDNVWEAYVSLRFDGPTYGGTGTVDLVWVDRIVLVRRSTERVDRYVVKGNPGAAGPYNTWAKAAPDIQTAIDAAVAANGDEVIVAPGVYDSGGRVSGASGHLLTNRVVIDKAITVRSRDDAPGGTLIQGAWRAGTTNGAGVVRCVYMANGARLAGFTLTNGATLTTAASAQYLDHLGGGILARQAACVVSNCVVAGNAGFGSTAQGVGGAGVNGGTYFDCTIKGNVSATYGGGAGGCYLRRCGLIGNRARRGGAGYRVWLYEGCVVSNNVATAEYGGGITGHDISLAFRSEASDTLFVGNRAATGGGGVYNSRVERCSLVSNTANSHGGGAAFSTLVECGVSSNRAVLGGGAYGSALTNCVIAYNRASSSGGGLFQPARAVNCLVYGNTGYGGGAYLRNDNRMENCTVMGNSSSGVLIESGGETAHLRNCILYTNTPNRNWVVNGGNLSFDHSCTYPAQGGWSAGNFTNQPRFMAGGSGVGTNHVPGDYRLRASSPCVDGGTNQAWMTGAVDLDRYPRIDVRQGRVDMGCYERTVGAGTLFKFR